MKLLKELPELTEADDTVKLDPIKPRDKKGHDILRSKKGGRHYNARTDYVRSKEKSKIRRDAEE